MPKNEVSDLITDQEIAFVHLIFSGTMTDQRAAAAVGLNPDTAAYIKSKPCVRAYMLEHRALMQQQLIEQQTEGLRPLNPGREQVLGRLWELANLSSEMTRGSITGQVKAMSMIVAIEGLIPDRRAGSAQKNPAPPPTNVHIYHPPWFGKQQEETNGPQPNPAPDQEDQDEAGLGLPRAEPALGSAADAPPQSPSHAAFVPDTRVPFSIPRNPFRPRR